MVFLRYFLLCFFILSATEQPAKKGPFYSSFLKNFSTTMPPLGVYITEQPSGESPVGTYLRSNIDRLHQGIQENPQIATLGGLGGIAFGVGTGTLWNVGAAKSLWCIEKVPTLADKIPRWLLSSFKGSTNPRARMGVLVWESLKFCPIGIGRAIDQHESLKEKWTNFVSWFRGKPRHTYNPWRGF